MLGDSTQPGSNRPDWGKKKEKGLEVQTRGGGRKGGSQIKNNNNKSSGLHWIEGMIENFGYNSHHMIRGNNYGETKW